MVTVCEVSADTKEKPTLLAELEKLGKEVQGRIERGELTTRKKVIEALRDGTSPISVRHRVDGALPPEKIDVIRAWRMEIETELLEGVRSE